MRGFMGQRSRGVIVALVFSAWLFPVVIFAGSLDSPGVPGHGSGMPTLQGIYNQLDTGTTAGSSTSFQEPTAGPTVGTGKSLSDIKSKLPVPDNTNGLKPNEAPNGKTFWGLNKDGGSWGPQTGSNPNVVDTGSGDVTAADISCGKKAWVKGVEITGIARPRFKDNGDGTVTDDNTGLIWLKNANCFGGKTWQQAMDAAAALASGQCGLTDGSAAGDWRLPQDDNGSLREWRDFINTSYTAPALSNGCGTAKWTNGDVFDNVQSDYYWSSTGGAYDIGKAWAVHMWNGYVGYRSYFSNSYVWPVRSGQ